MKEKQCKIKDCKKICNTYKGGAHGLCVGHYRRLLRYGDPVYKPPKGDCVFSGYKFKCANGTRYRIHRLVMEKRLRRKLKSDEIVHHINGNKLDNNINNLQLMTRSEHLRFHNPLSYRWKSVNTT